MITIRKNKETTPFLLYKTQVNSISKLVIQNEITQEERELEFDVEDLMNAHKITLKNVNLDGFGLSNLLLVYNNNNLIYKEMLQYDIR